jgi:hypothetical protein
LERLVEGHALCRDDVHEGTALKPREDGLVEGLGVDLLAQDQSAAWPAERLVGGRGHEVTVRHGARVLSGSNHPRDVGDVGHDQGPSVAPDRPDPLEVEDPGIGRRAADDQLRPVLLRERF